MFKNKQENIDLHMLKLNINYRMTLCTKCSSNCGCISCNPEIEKLSNLIKLIDKKICKRGILTEEDVKKLYTKDFFNYLLAEIREGKIYSNKKLRRYINSYVNKTFTNKAFEKVSKYISNERYRNIFNFIHIGGNPSDYYEIGCSNITMIKVFDRVKINVRKIIGLE